MKMILNLFAGSLTVTVYKDSGITTASASPASSLSEEDSVALTITPASNYVLDEIEVIEGGVTPEYDPDDGWGFTMGDADVVLYVKSKAASKYMVTEEVSLCINGAWTVLHANNIITLTKNGVPCAVTAKSGGTTVSSNDAVASLVEQGILIPL